MTDTTPQHRPVTAEVADLECLERECQEFFTDDGDEIPGDEIPGKDTCSHSRQMVICEACSDLVVGDGDPHPPVVAWSDCPQHPAAASA